MIKIFPTRIEANNEIGDVIFILNTIDENICDLEFKSHISNSNICEILDAIKRGVEMLELEG